MEEMPLSLWLWLCLGLVVDSGSVQQSVGELGWIGPPVEDGEDDNDDALMITK